MVDIDTIPKIFMTNINLRLGCIAMHLRNNFEHIEKYIYKVYMSHKSVL